MSAAAVEERYHQCDQPVRRNAHRIAGGGQGPAGTGSGLRRTQLHGHLLAELFPTGEVCAGVELCSLKGGSLPQGYVVSMNKKNKIVQLYNEEDDGIHEESLNHLNQVQSQVRSITFRL